MPGRLHGHHAFDDVAAWPYMRSMLASLPPVACPRTCRHHNVGGLQQASSSAAPGWRGVAPAFLLVP